MTAQASLTLSVHNFPIIRLRLTAHLCGTRRISAVRVPQSVGGIAAKIALMPLCLSRLREADGVFGPRWRATKKGDRKSEKKKTKTYKHSVQI